MNILMELGKVRITSFVAFSTAAGYVLSSGEIAGEMILPIFGVFLLASGSSALNHYQERDIDAKMERTRNRPIPSGAISGGHALAVLITLIIIGLTILGTTTGWTGASLGAFAVFWYNGFYTPLKRKTPMAVVPGALIGSIPPAIGWVAAGGGITDPGVIALALFFFIWQIPHFWLLLLLYEKDYERGGFPTLNLMFSQEQLTRITFTWIAALSTSGLLIPLFGLGDSNSIFVTVVLFVLGLWLVVKSRRLLKRYYERITYRFAFREVNTFVLVVVILLSINKLINY